MARERAPIDDESDLPRSVSLVSLLGKQESDSPEAVVERWRENGSLIVRDGRQPQPVDNPVELRAIVGHAGLEPFVIDLRRDGPHALVGGTTGAGKSEFLQAWVLGLAHALSPDRVNYLFVDYKVDLFGDFAFTGSGGYGLNFGCATCQPQGNTVLSAVITQPQYNGAFNPYQTAPQAGAAK